MVISSSILLITIIISGKIYGGNHNIHFMFNNYFLENSAICEIIWKSIVEPGSPQMTICCMRIACWIRKATNTHSEYVILVAIPRQRRFRERASTFRYM